MNLFTQKFIYLLSLFRCAVCLVCLSNVTKEFGNSSTRRIYIGCEFENWKGEKCTAFRGIRYAKPPIDDLRFKDPVPIEDSTLLEDAQNGGKDCPSIFTNNSSEDCLFLNVYSRAVTNASILRPVIVFIHPGGFYLGSGSSSFLGPEYLLEKDIIVVTFNYRLGSLGFLNLGTKEIPGNAGLKDQVMALRWVKKHIQHFDGDPNNVTLIGYSAGAMSVCLHLVSPMSQGLFHKAIIMSASIPPQTKIPLHNQFDLAKKQALLMGCEESLLTHPNAILECLSQFSGEEISKTLRKMFHFGKDNPIYLWLPVIEQNYAQERFLNEDPYVSLKEGRFAKVPLLIGFTNGEFCTSAQEILSNEVLREQFEQNFEKFAPICFMYSEHEKENEITQAIKSEYFQNDTRFQEKHFVKLCELFSDSIIRFGAQKIASLVAEYGNVYQYKFSFRGNSSYLNYPGHNAVEHMDDIMYLFKMPLKHFAPDDAEAKVVENVVHFFTTFAKNGKPEEDFEYKKNKFVEITERIAVKGGQHFEHFQFWNSVI